MQSPALVRPASSQRRTWLVVSCHSIPSPAPDPAPAFGRTRRPDRSIRFASRASTSPVGAPESCSSRQNACSRRLTGSANNAETWAARSGAVAAAGCLCRRPAVGSARIHPWPATSRPRYAGRTVRGWPCACRCKRSAPRVRRPVARWYRDRQAARVAPLAGPHRDAQVRIDPPRSCTPPVPAPGRPVTTYGTQEAGW
jgi:hypothetical protein